MSSEPAIRVEGLGKRYTIRHHRSDHVTLAQVALERARHPFRRAEREQFWALRDVSFEVHRGDVLGLIGRNGAGKSTLLKCLSRITSPTTGRIELWGRVGSLLEVGTGFHPELTGRENIYLNGSILGMTRREIDRQFDAIVDFAGVERFLDTPVKRYSSGMYVRLAFAVAAHLETEILLVDEVLAVGDQEFQEKCFRAMGELAGHGRTVVFVSHQLSSVARLCDRALLLVDGRVAELGPVDDVIAVYLADLERRDARTPISRVGSGELRITTFEPTSASFRPDAEKTFVVEVEPIDDNAPRYFVSLEVYDSQRTKVAHCDSRVLGGYFEGPQRLTVRIRSPWLRPGRYQVDAFVCSSGIIDGLSPGLTFAVEPTLPYPGTLPDEDWRTALLPDFTVDATAPLRDCTPATGPGRVTR